ncbi:MAG: phenylalanine--tRNA ligase subunit alpha [bacterium]|nr:phenylalanine--tRNA ligase subunit alpha [bacterium]
MDELDRLRTDAFRDLDASADAGELEAVRVAYVGRKGKLTEILRSLAKRPIAERKSLGSAANAFRDEFELQLKVRAAALAKETAAVARQFDPTKPGAKLHRGHLHPLTLVDADVRRIFTGMNFTVVEGPEVETERYNFDALNIPANHPAREMWDTFWITDNKQQTTNNKARRRSSVVGRKLLMRTHTSPMQVRYMEAHNPPFQIIVPGRTFRYEATDASHEINFYQVEGLMVGPDISLANFKYVVERFFTEFFRGQAVTFRFRPSYFPFVEPGLEVDIKVTNNRQPMVRHAHHPERSRGTTNNQQKETWLEVMGAGMVHRRVFDAVRYNPDEIQGFAFGVGLDRLAMIKYGIPDIRLFYGADLRFVRQF